MRVAFFLCLGTTRDSNPVGSGAPMCRNLPFLIQHFDPDVRIVSAKSDCKDVIYDCCNIFFFIHNVVIHNGQFVTTGKCLIEA